MKITSMITKPMDSHWLLLIQLSWIKVHHFYSDNKLHFIVRLTRKVCYTKDDIYYASIVNFSANGINLNMVGDSIENIVELTWQPITEDLDLHPLK